MELDRFDYVILKLLNKQHCTSCFESMSIQEIISITGTTRATTYRKIRKLIEPGYVNKGCKTWNADTYYLTDKSLMLLESIRKGNIEND